MLLKYSNRLERLKKVGGMMKERYDKIEAEEPAEVQLCRTTVCVQMQNMFSRQYGLEASVYSKMNEEF